MTLSSTPRTINRSSSLLVPNEGIPRAFPKNRIAIRCLLPMILILIAIPAFLDAAPCQHGYRVIGQLVEQKDVAEEEQVTVTDVIDVIRKRIDPTGQKDFEVQELRNGQVEITFPKTSREEVVQLWARLTWSGNLTFRIVADKNQHPELVEIAVDSASQPGSTVHRRNAEGEQDPSPIGQWVGLARERAADGDPADLHAFRFLPEESHLLRDGETGEIISFDSSHSRGSDLKKRRQNFNAWCLRNEHRVVEILVSAPTGEAENVNGGFLADVRKGLSGIGAPRIEFSLDETGGDRMFLLTSRNAPVDGRFRMLGIVLDNELLTAPRLNEPIRHHAVIEGNFTEAEVDNLAAVLSSGELKIPLQETWISITEADAEMDQ